MERKCTLLISAVRLPSFSIGFLLLKATKDLGVRAEKGSGNAAKQAEIQREFVELVQCGAGLGVDGMVMKVVKRAIMVLCMT